MYKKTLVVNLIGGPSSGKSSMAAGLFSKLKWNKVRSELVTEYAKHAVWEESTFQLTNQIYLFGQQHHKQFILNGKVDVIITDSPIILGAIYDTANTPYLKELMLSEFNKFWNFNILLERKKEYDKVGRMQTEQEAIQKDIECKKFLNDNNIEYITLPGEEASIEIIYNKILKLLNDTRN